MQLTMSIGTRVNRTVNIATQKSAINPSQKNGTFSSSSPFNSKNKAHIANSKLKAKNSKESLKIRGDIGDPRVTRLYT